MSDRKEVVGLRILSPAALTVLEREAIKDGSKNLEVFTQELNFYLADSSLSRSKRREVAQFKMYEDTQKISVLPSDRIFSDGKMYVFDLENDDKHQILVLLAQDYSPGFMPTRRDIVAQRRSIIEDVVVESVRMVNDLVSANAKFMNNNELVDFLCGSIGEK